MNPSRVTRTDLSRVARVVAPVSAVVLAGAAGWVLAGAPADGAGTVPPACPPALVGPAVLAAPAPGDRSGVPDRLVPVPLPQPRGPVSVRLCAYAADGAPLGRQATLDPPRTGELAGVMNTPGAGAVAVTARPAGCAGGPVTLLLFRYTQGEPLVARLDGACDLVSTSARAERGRADVAGRVRAALGR